MTVFTSLSDGHGKQPVKVNMVRVDNKTGDEDEVFAASGDVTFPSPSNVVDLVMEFHNVTFKQDGQYIVQIWLGDDMVGERRISVVKQQKGAKQ